ncbi:DUF1080 domain-containing protein, partial [Persicitalea sp.]|uniref:3-keto-disaccharide hydrolase n=1 Tax=Persicitalea sp. TaxID=3100273 RepID=UPI0035943A90
NFKISVCLLTTFLLWSCDSQQNTDQKLFNGDDLAGWSAANPKYWSVEDGAIVANAQAEVPRNEFLWSDTEVRDFYLKAEVLMERNEGNAGIQFRSTKADSTGQALGYQADMGKGVWGRLYHEHGRQKLFWSDRGEQAVKPGKWNTYEILAVGDRIWTAINGRLAVAVRDTGGDEAGYIALQLHAGPPQTVRYRIKEFLKNPKVELAGMGEKTLNEKLEIPMDKQ